MRKTAVFSVALWFALATAAHAGVVGSEVHGNTVDFKLSDGAARLEWISVATLRWTKAPAAAALPITLDREPVSFKPGERDGWLTFENKYVRVEVNKLDAHVRFSSADTNLLRDESVKAAEPRWASDDGFVLSSKGYGEFSRRQSNPAVEERFFYYGPSLKEVLEQHMLAMGQTEGLGPEAVEVLKPGQLPREAAKPPSASISSWDALRAFVKELNTASLKAILYPSIDLGKIADPVRSRATQLAALLPLVVDSRERAPQLASRERWKPYLITYFREARDRGFPLIRPLILQYPKDPKSSEVDDEFLLGDELLVAPILSETAGRSVYLPMGIWTDLRTNREYKGRQTVAVETTTSEIPIFVKNGALVPIANSRALELHYFPKLGSEFFLWEPEIADISQFHANPIIGDVIRLESEAKAEHLCEWIVHHSGAPKSVQDAMKMYRQVASRDALQPGTWFHDSDRNNLHVMNPSVPGGDEIININY